MLRSYDVEGTYERWPQFLQNISNIHVTKSVTNVLCIDTKLSTFALIGLRHIHICMHF